eukprot:jgi/Tetstr1/427123/TSEL_001710.t1
MAASGTARGVYELKPGPNKGALNADNNGRVATALLVPYLEGNSRYRIGSAPRAIRAPHEERSQTLPSKRRRVVCGSDARRDMAPGSQLPSDEALEPYILQVEGRSFMCTLCGKCCTGKGEVWISDEEGLRIAASLNMNKEQFHRQYTKSYRKYDGWRLLKYKSNLNDDCIFLQPDNTCGIHDVRPSQCATYPWWPEIVAEDTLWEQERDDVCEGLSHPEATALDVISAARMLKQQTDMEERRKKSYRRKGRSPSET